MCRGDGVHGVLSLSLASAPAHVVKPGSHTESKFVVPVSGRRRAWGPIPLGYTESKPWLRLLYVSSIDYDVPTRLETTSKSCLQPITGPITIEGYTGVGMDVVGAGCEDRRKYQWWTLGEQPYDNVWHTSHTHKQH